MKYRIIKKEKKYGDGNTYNVFYIQKKYLCFWIKVRIRMGYRLSRYNGVLSDLMLERCYVKFQKEQDVNDALDKYMLNPIKERYKGNRLIRVMSQTCESYYVNKSNLTGFYANKACYEYALSLEELKDRIDERELNSVTKSIIQ